MLAVVLVLALSTTALAATYDFHSLQDPSKVYDKLELASSKDKRLEVFAAAGNWAIEAEDGSLYGLKDVSDKMGEGKSFEDAIADLEPVTPPSEELEVVSVSAIDDMKIAKDKDVELKFLVNGEEEVTKAEFDEKYGEEGYTVEFKYTFSGATEDERAGKVNKKNDFRYAVQVKDAEDNLIPEKLVAADYKKVEVVEAGKAVEVTELGLEDWDLDYVTTTDEDVKIEVVKAIDALGVEVKDAQLPKIKKVVSDDIRIAYYNRDGIVPVKAGEVTFTVEFDNEDVEDVEYTVEVKAGQKATSIDVEEPVKVKAKEASTVKFDVLDQYEEKLRTEAELSVKVGEADAEDINVTDGVATLQDLNLEKGTHKVVVKADNKEIGTFDIQAVDVVEGEIDEYKLVFDTEKTSLDINPLKLENGADTLEINVEAYIDGVEVELDGTELEAKSSDVDVATVKLEEGTITVTAKAEGTVTVSLYTVEGDLEVKVAELDVEVKNTTPQIDTLKTDREDGKFVVADEQSTGPIELTEQLLAQLTTEDVDLAEIEAGMMNIVEEVRYVENNHQVVVTVKDEFGGKSFVFDAITEKVAAATAAVEKAEEAVMNLDAKNYDLNRDSGKLKLDEDIKAAQTAHEDAAEAVDAVDEELYSSEVSALEGRLADVQDAIDEAQRQLDMDVTVDGNASYFVEVTLIGASFKEDVEKVVLSIWLDDTLQASATGTEALLELDQNPTGKSFNTGTSSYWIMEGEVGTGEEAPNLCKAEVTFKSGKVVTVEGNLLND